MTDYSLEDKSSGDGLEDNKSKDLDYDFICFFLTSQRLDLYRLIDFRCEDMLSGKNDKDINLSHPIFPGLHGFKFFAFTKLHNLVEVRDLEPNQCVLSLVRGVLGAYKGE